ncbi:hypothetical protein VXO74_10215 [Acinetobacter junii]|uniref:hypothetical protein n=1 Tax=Acinetobacter junii TaxID=40215 RepID=UPI003A8BDD2A
MEVYTMNEAAEFLSKELAQELPKTKQQWWGYLKWNPQRWKQQGGVRINCYLVGGELFYTSGSLKAFASLFKPVGYYQNKRKRAAK